MLNSSSDPRVAAAFALLAGVVALLSVEIVALVLGATGMVTGSLALWLVSSHLKDIEKETHVHERHTAALAASADEITNKLSDD